MNDEQDVKNYIEKMAELLIGTVDKMLIIFPEESTKKEMGKAIISSALLKSM